MLDRSISLLLTRNVGGLGEGLCNFESHWGRMSPLLLNSMVSIKSMRFKNVTMSLEDRRNNGCTTTHVCVICRARFSQYLRIVNRFLTTYPTVRCYLHPREWICVMSFVYFVDPNRIFRTSDSFTLRRILRMNCWIVHIFVINFTSRKRERHNSLLSDRMLVKCNRYFHKSLKSDTSLVNGVWYYMT